MSKLNKATIQNWIPTIAGIIIVLLIGGGILAWQYRKVNEEVKQPIVSKEENLKQKQEVKSKKEETDNWKVYRNETLGFEIKYPPIMEIREVKDSEGNIAFISGTIPKAPDFRDLTITRNSRIDCEDEDTWLAHCDYICQQEKDKEVRKDIKVNGYPAKFVSRSESTMKGPVRRVYVCIESNPPVTFDVAFDKEKEGKYLSIFNQILSTFRFVSKH